MPWDVPNPKVTFFLCGNITYIRSCSFEVTSIMPFINAMPASVLSSASCANVCVRTKITCMVSTRARSIFAGVYTVDVAVIFVPYRYYRQEHLCTAICAARGICNIETAPHSIEATFTGKNETFQYTKVCFPVSIVGSDTDPSCSILRVR